MGSLALSPDGRTLAVGQLDETVLLNVATRAVTRHLRGGRGPIHAMFLPSGRLVTLGRNDTQASLWDAATGALVEQQQGGYRCAQFYQMAWACDDEAQGWQVRHGPSAAPRTVGLVRWGGAAPVTLTTVTDHAMYGAGPLAVTRDGAFATGSRGAYSSTRTEQIFVHRGDPASGAVGLFPADTPAYIEGGYVRVWSRDGALRCEWTGLGREVRSLAFFPGGGRLLAGDASGSLAVLALEGCRVERTLRAHVAPVVGVGVTPDGTVAVSADTAGHVVFWNVASGHQRGAVVLAP